MAWNLVKHRDNFAFTCAQTHAMEAYRGMELRIQSFYICSRQSRVVSFKFRSLQPQENVLRYSVKSTLKEEHMLRASENRVLLKRILRHKWGEVTGGWRGLKNEETGHVATRYA
jgi:hypothetical protein